MQDSLAACGFETRSQIIWAKNNFAIGRGHYHCKHEPCWYVVRKASVQQCHQTKASHSGKASLKVMMAGN